jgi:hypothetical protein
MSEILCVDLPNIMHETIDNEVVIVNLDNGSYYSFDGVGGRIWQMMCEERISLETLISKVKAGYAGDADQIAVAVRDFVQRLRHEELIRVETDGEEKDEVEPASKEPVSDFIAPVLNKYTDMEALLLADPIHEVQEQGWPDLK